MCKATDMTQRFRRRGGGGQVGKGEGGEEEGELGRRRGEGELGWTGRWERGKARR